MKTILAIPVLVTGALFGEASAQSLITGTQSLQIGETASYATSEEPDVKHYHWIAPTGCRIASEDGNPEIQLTTTFLAQDSPLRVVRSFADEHQDTLQLSLTFCRPINGYQDHTISPGESILVNGVACTEADIYYEPKPSIDGCDQLIAHRLTIVPNTYAQMTKPYLQTSTSSSIWITWKTDYANTPVVEYGTDSQLLDQQQEGDTQQLSDTYYWNSVHLTGLKPGTAYYYRIRSGEQQSAIYRFRTQPSEGSRSHLRILLMGDHQIKSRSGYEWLMQAAKRKIEEKYGNLEDHINLIMNVGDQVDVGTLEQYEWIHLWKSQLMSPYLPIMTAVGNHETYSDPGMQTYASHYHYEDLSYQGISSGTENYYAYQVGRVLFVVLSTEHTGNEQKKWVRQIVNAAQTDDNVDFIISVNHRPIQAEQYIGDISAWVRNEIIPILNETPKHVLNYGGHHHLYHRGQWADHPLYHIINGAASWDQMWGMSSEKDYDDVQKTIDYWGYQILDFEFGSDSSEMTAECYAIGNRELVVDNLLIDTFHRIVGKAAPEKPSIAPLPETIEQPYTVVGSTYQTTTDEPLNSVQFQFAKTEDFSTLEWESIRDVEDLYGSTGKPWHIPVDRNEQLDITRLDIPSNQLKNGRYYVRVRYRDANLEWSEWSDAQSFTVIGSIDGDPAITMSQQVIPAGQAFTVTYQYAPEGQNAWIGLYHKGQTPGPNPSTKWAYVEGNSGNLTFQLEDIDEYFAVLFEDGGYTEAAPRIAFYVGPTPTIQTNKNTYEEGESITINYSNAPGLSGDWIGIYRMGKIPGTSDLSDSWAYTSSGSTNGQMSLGSQLGKGYYFVNYFLRGEYFEPVERCYFSIGNKISTVSADRDEYATTDEIRIYYEDGPGTPKDWIGFFLEGKDPNKDELDGFYYTYGATDGYITVQPGDLPAGRYFCALYINDSYEEVSDRIYLTIKEAADPTNISQTKATESIYPNPATDILCFEGHEGTTVQVLSMLGVCVWQQTIHLETNQIQIGHLPAGIYMLQTTDGKFLGKFIKE
ncbi:MAG: fibronectin type III domain-containing protein [Bacteroidaceae bacterium]